jgi:hypothetical protein
MVLIMKTPLDRLPRHLATILYADVVGYILTIFDNTLTYKQVPLTWVGAIKLVTNSFYSNGSVADSTGH